ncbi:hypothetical protein BHM03_00002344 [Ensete ventricosum]|nr:hypothetical protein BHM03_00002344 [Ensete ventricosum]
MKGVDVEDGTWSRGTKLSLDKDSSCMVPKTKGASRHMHLILEKHLMEELRRLHLRKAKLGSEGLSTGQEDAEVSTLGEYVTVLSFELS